MSSANPRPTFSFPTSLDDLELMGRMKRMVENQSQNIEGQFKSNHGIVTIIESKRHFWSPWLHLEIRQTEQTREVFGRFSPHPSIWTGFVFSYLAMIVLTFFSSILGVSQLLAKQFPLGFWLVPIWLVTCGCLWIASQIGQRLAHDEMDMLKNLTESAIETSFDSK